MGTAVVLNPGDLDRLISEMKSKVIEEIKTIKGIVIEKPMSRQEAAGFLTITIGNLHKRIKRGDIPKEMVHYNGGTPYFFASELRDLIKNA